MSKPAQTPVELASRVARALELEPSGVRAVLTLLGEGATVPFIARYRKERTGALDEGQIRAIESHAASLAELDARKAAVLRSLDEQGIADPALRNAIAECTDRRRLEDLYLPHKPKRRTKAQLARELGLEKLAERILAQPHSAQPDRDVQKFVTDDCPNADAAWAGAHDIVVERVAEDAPTRAELRRLFRQRGLCKTKATKEANEDSKYRDYFAARQPLKGLRGHRYLAMRRGEAAGELRLTIEVEGVDVPARMAARHGLRRASAYAERLEKAINEAYSKRLRPSISKEIRSELDERFDAQAVEVFADNLEQLLLAPPLGPHTVIGIDPGLRTGCKCVVVDQTGQLLEHAVLYFETRKNSGAIDELRAWIDRHKPRAIAVGNGTGGREAQSFIENQLGRSKDCLVVSVNEAGASVYSASDVARAEFPDLDLTIRGAISIARRLQDPLAALVEIEAKAIGVGQYQHDVPQALLERRLSAVVEDCVNRVGVALNSASQSLLAHVAGIGAKQAAAIVAHRSQHGAFPDRRSLLKVTGMGPKKFEQCAGFLRVADSQQALDNSAVHPERYALVEEIARDAKTSVRELIGDEAELAKIDTERYLSQGIGQETLSDIFDELRQPGRDPRDDFSAPEFREDINAPADLEVGMELSGVVTNVTAFGAFVDIGVHQDGLVHISKLARKFVSNPSDVVQVGQQITVWVVEVDLRRKRIALSAVGPA